MLKESKIQLPYSFGFPNGHIFDNRPLIIGAKKLKLRLEEKVSRNFTLNWELEIYGREHRDFGKLLEELASNFSRKTIKSWQNDVSKAEVDIITNLKGKS